MDMWTQNFTTPLIIAQKKFEILRHKYNKACTGLVC